MTKTCICGNEFEAKGRRKTCPKCSYERLKGKVRARMHRVRRDLFGPLVKDRASYQVTAKCPCCPEGRDRHIVTLDYQPRIMPRIFCPKHEVLKHFIYADTYTVSGGLRI